MNLKSPQMSQTLGIGVVGEGSVSVEIVWACFFVGLELTVEKPSLLLKNICGIGNVVLKVVFIDGFGTCKGDATPITGDTVFFNKSNSTKPNITVSITQNHPYVHKPILKPKKPIKTNYQIVFPKRKEGEEEEPNKCESVLNNCQKGLSI
ncbi:hypothetical protein FQA39_LY13561 [Lamprigera yunnana]|nr:hypothetical protein FQA39_LY13561 [Lamprigera yunnana]